MHTRMKRIFAVCGMMVMLVLMAGITAVSAFATSEGAYIAEACPSYKNPETNEVEDVGGESSAVLGQAMTESAVYEKALVEIDADGNTFITVRMQLMDNIENPKFEENGEALTAEIVQEDFENDTADFRMAVKDYHSDFHCSMTVTAMGRDVVFYLNFKNLQPGTEDFISSMPAAAEAPVEEETPVEEKQEESPEATTELQQKETKETENTGIQEFDAQGNEINTKNDSTSVNSSKMGSFGIIIAVVAAVAVIGFSVWYFGFFRKKK